MTDSREHILVACRCTSEPFDTPDCPYHQCCDYCGAAIHRTPTGPEYQCGPDCKEPSFHG